MSAAIDLNQLINKWVRSGILDENLGTGREGLKERSKTKQYFVDTAKVCELVELVIVVNLNHSQPQECQNIRNFSSSGAIMSALQSDVIDRLYATHGGMTVLAKWKYRHLVKFFEPNSDYQDYRKELKDKQKGCIPWHGAPFH